MVTNCASLVAYLFFSIMRETPCCLFHRISNLKLLKLSILFLDYLSNIDNNFLYSMVNHMYPSELLLNKGNVSDTHALFWICI